MRKFLLILSMAILACFPNIKAQEKLIGGFGKEASEAQFQLESQFDKQLNNVSIGQNIKELSAHPHHLGSPGGKAVAEAILGKFKQYGWNAKIETYHVLFPTPKTRILELTSPTVYKALLEEPALKEDATSDQQGMLPTYNAWGADGDVTAGLVYVNYGLPDDYDQLNRLNIDVKGKIVIARYGHSWRGIKPKIAQEHGAIGCIIYSDPKDDGFYQGDVYPKGSFRNEFGVQRGSVMDMVIYPGDPLTPGIGATEKAQRLDRNDASTILKIPVLPISYHDALAFLKVLDGPVVPDNWRGALPITYHVGSGTAVVRLKVESNWDIVPAYDVIATIRGSEFPDQWVIRGNHHDAWVFGAGDPVSGQAALLEEAKAIGTLCKNGWKPKRTLVYCAWDGEEPALLGSTEWAEDHAAELQRKAVAYINTDGNGRGFFDVGGSQALETFVTEITKEVIDPQENVSIYERQKALEATSAGSAKKRKEILSKPEFPVSALGSGSDYTAFLQHLGIPTLNMGFGGEDNGGEYHSIYDSYDNYSRFMDPDFHYGVTLAQTAGRTVLRLANAEVLPFDFRILQKTIGNYLEEVTKYAEELKETTEMDNLLIKNKYYLLASDPLKQLKVPEVKSDVPVIDFSELKTTLAFLSVSANLLSDVIAKKGTSIPNLKELNEHLYTAEQSLLIPEGLPKRPWFRHAIYAPGFYTGYGVKTLPGITEAIEQRNWQEVKEQIARTAKSIHEFTIFLDKTIELVK